MTFAEVADILLADFRVIENLHRLASRGVELLDARATAIMLSDDHGRLTLLVCSTDEADMIELFEFQSDEGPALDCVRSDSPAGHADVAGMHEAWPVFTRRLVGVGCRSAHAVPLRLGSAAIGALSFLRSAESPLPAAHREIGMALADVADVGMIQNRGIAARHRLARQFQAAINDRVVLEQATGVLIERTGLRIDGALTLIGDYARLEGRSLGDVARAIVDGSSDGSIYETLRWLHTRR